MSQGASNLTNHIKKQAAPLVKIRYGLAGTPEENRIKAGNLLEGEVYLNKVRIFIYHVLVQLLISVHLNIGR